MRVCPLAEAMPFQPSNMWLFAASWLPLKAIQELGPKQLELGLPRSKTVIPLTHASNPRLPGENLEEKLFSTCGLLAGIHPPAFCASQMLVACLQTDPIRDHLCFCANPRPVQPKFLRRAHGVEGVQQATDDEPQAREPRHA